MMSINDNRKQGLVKGNTDYTRLPVLHPVRYPRYPGERGYTKRWKMKEGDCPMSLSERGGFRTESRVAGVVQ